MATIKSYTDISQSKRLAEILPLESADMCYQYQKDRWVGEPAYKEYPQFEIAMDKRDIPCWSLAALLNVIPYTIYKSDNEFYRLGIDKGYNDYAVWYNNNGFTITDLDVASDNFVDACVEMIIKLKDLNLL